MELSNWVILEESNNLKKKKKRFINAGADCKKTTRDNTVTRNLVIGWWRWGEQLPALGPKLGEESG